MKNKICLLAFGLFFFPVSLMSTQSSVHFQVKKEDPATGLTLGWMLSADKLQRIVGDNFKPLVKDGKGFLMLFVATAKKYYLNSKSYDNLKIAHILIPVEGTNCINAPLSILVENQKVNVMLKRYNFKMEIGKIDLDLNHRNDSIFLDAKIITVNGELTIQSAFLNNPGELKSIENTEVSATEHPTRIFSGPETYIPIAIPSVTIITTGDSWLSQLDLPIHPDKATLNTDFVWDFVFEKKSLNRTR